MRSVICEIEYAGFYYTITLVDGFFYAEPKPGQHKAAGKDKHRRAAIEQFLEERVPK